MKNKVFSAQEAVARVKDGDHIMVGGFLQGGTPDVTVRELIRQGKKNLTVTSNDTGREGCAVYDLVFAGHVDRVIADYIGLNPKTGQMMIENPGSTVSPRNAGGKNPRRRFWPRRHFDANGGGHDCRAG